MFAKAAERYAFQLKRILITLPSLLLIDAGISFSSYSRLISPDTWQRILTVQLFYWPVILVAGLIGYLIWMKMQKPLREEALKFLKALHDH